MTVGNSNNLPEVAEAFLARLGSLPQAAWIDVVERDRRPLFPTLKDLVRGLWFSVIPRQLRAGSGRFYSEVAADRLKQLAEDGALPMHLGWRAYHAAGSALQALCNRGALLETTVREMYAPFEPHIPFASLSAGPSST
jgi:hypothetical protein